MLQLFVMYNGAVSKYCNYCWLIWNLHNMIIKQKGEHWHWKHLSVHRSKRGCQLQHRILLAFDCNGKFCRHLNWTVYNYPQILFPKICQLIWTQKYACKIQISSPGVSLHCIHQFKFHLPFSCPVAKLRWILWNFTKHCVALTTILMNTIY